jgi:hypothetical protein
MSSPGNELLVGGPGPDEVVYHFKCGRLCTYPYPHHGVEVDLRLTGPQNTHGRGFDELVSIEYLVARFGPTSCAATQRPTGSRATLATTSSTAVAVPTTYWAVPALIDASAGRDAMSTPSASDADLSHPDFVTGHPLISVRRFASRAGDRVPGSSSVPA